VIELAACPDAREGHGERPALGCVDRHQRDQHRIERSEVGLPRESDHMGDDELERVIKERFQRLFAPDATNACERIGSRTRTGRWREWAGGMTREFPDAGLPNILCNSEIGF